MKIVKQSPLPTVVHPKLGVLGHDTDGLGGFDTQVGVARAPEVSLTRIPAKCLEVPRIFRRSDV